jgi:hypothetical protein
MGNFSIQQQCEADLVTNAPVSFDLSDETEIAMQTPAGNLSEMQISHYAFIGIEFEKYSYFPPKA